MRSELPLDNPEALLAFRQGQALLDHGGREDALAGSRTLPSKRRRWRPTSCWHMPSGPRRCSRSTATTRSAPTKRFRSRRTPSHRRCVATTGAARPMPHSPICWSRRIATGRARNRRSGGRSSCSPSSEYARIRFAMMLSGRGRTDEAVAQTHEAQSLNPRSSSLRGYAGAALHYAEPVCRSGADVRGDAAARFAVHGGVDRPLQGLHGTRPVHAGHRRLRAGAQDRRRRADVRRVTARAGLRGRRTPAPMRAAISPGSSSSTRKPPNGDTAFWLALAYAA